MKVPKSLAILVGLVILWPFVYMVLFFASFFGEATGHGQPDSMPIFGTFEAMMTLHLATMALMMGLLVFYVVHAFKNPQLASDKRLLWVVVLFFGSFIAGLVYWWFYVWPTSKQSPPGGSSELAS